MLVELKILISRYLQERVTFFPDKKIRPKHHYLEHYAYLMSVYGPLSKVSSLCFESKHTFCKNVIRSTKNLKNVTLTLDSRHQASQKTLCSNFRLNNHPIVTAILEKDSLSMDVLAFLQRTFGRSFLAAVTCSEKVTFRGIDYRHGALVVNSDKE